MSNSLADSVPAPEPSTMNPGFVLSRVAVVAVGVYVGVQVIAQITEFGLRPWLMGGTLLGAVRTGNRQVQGRQKLVDIGNLAAGNDGKSTAQFMGSALKFSGQVFCDLHTVRRGGKLNQRAIEVGKNRQLGNCMRRNSVDFGHRIYLCSKNILPVERRGPGLVRS